MRLAIALALVSLIALLAGCDGLHRASTSSVVVSHVALHAATKHVAAHKSIVPHSGRKALEEDDDDDDDGTDAATCVRSHQRHARGFALSTRRSDVPTRTLVDRGRLAPPVEAQAPQRLVLATHEARGPPQTRPS